MLTARFDWYAATIQEYPDVLIGTLSDALGGEVVHLPKAMNGYESAVQVKVKDHAACTILWGGKNGHPHAFASSDSSSDFSELVRTLWPASHHVTRMDAAIDFESPGSWDDLHPIVEGVALGDDPLDGSTDIRRRIMPLAISHAGDWTRAIDDPLATGRTFYVGSAQSAVRVYLYEKGKEIRTKRDAAGLPPMPGISDDWVRLEARVRPAGDSRFAAALSTPREAYGYADWSRELLRRVEGTEAVPRVHIKERRESDHERRMFWLLRQYGPALLEEAERVGGWDHLGPALRDRMKDSGGDTDIDLDRYKPGGERLPF